MKYYVEYVHWYCPVHCIEAKDIMECLDYIPVSLLNQVLAIYRESDTPNGRPFIVEYEK